MKKRTFITLSDEQLKKLEMLKEEYAFDNLSAFVARLIVDEARRLEQEKNKRGPGRPRKEEEELSPEEEAFELDLKMMEPEYWVDDLPKNMVYYGRKIGPKEWEFLKNRKITL